MRHVKKGSMHTRKVIRFVLVMVLCINAIVPAFAAEGEPTRITRQYGREGDDEWPPTHLANITVTNVTDISYRVHLRRTLDNWGDWDNDYHFDPLSEWTRPVGYGQVGIVGDHGITGITVVHANAPAVVSVLDFGNCDCSALDAGRFVIYRINDADRSVERVPISTVGEIGPNHWTTLWINQNDIQSYSIGRYGYHLIPTEDRQSRPFWTLGGIYVPAGSTFVLEEGRYKIDWLDCAEGSMIELIVSGNGTTTVQEATTVQEPVPQPTPEPTTLPTPTQAGDFCYESGNWYRGIATPWAIQ